MCFEGVRLSAAPYILYENSTARLEAVPFKNRVEQVVVQEGAVCVWEW
jgi:hypothetical protein